MMQASQSMHDRQRTAGRATRSVRQRSLARRAAGERIRVGFFVLYDSAFPGLSLALALRDDARFEPIIVIVPDTLRGEQHMDEQMRRTRTSFASTGIRIVDQFETSDARGEDEPFEFVCLSNPYDELTRDPFTSEWLASRAILVFFISYGMGVSTLHSKVVQREAFQRYWRVFVPTRWHRHHMLDRSSVRRRAIDVSGYPKMDGLAALANLTPDRPTVIVAPHHTVRPWAEGIEIGTFLLFGDAILDLMREFPQVNFVVRPHPLLFPALAADDLWGGKRLEQYVAEIERLPNARLDTAAEYLETFARSTALIHDSGSFAAEYLFTGRPALYLAAPDRDPRNNFNDLGRRCLDAHYHADSIQGIRQFVEGTVLGGRDPLGPARRRFVKRELMTHWPRATERIVRRLASAAGVR